MDKYAIGEIKPVEPEPVKPPTNFDVIESLNFVWDCLNEFNPEDGLKNRFSEDTWDDICTAMSWIEDGCDVERKEGVLEFKTETTLTTEYFWDCECEKNYIHPKTEEMCGKCGYHHHEMPDSRTVEVIRMLSGDLSWAESKNKENTKSYSDYTGIISQLTESLDCDADEIVNIVNLLNMTEYWVENKMLDVCEDNDVMRKVLWADLQEFIQKYKPQNLSVEELYVADKSEGDE